MDIASLRAKLDNIAEELAQLPEQDTVAIEEETIEEADMMPKTLKCKECGDMLGNPTTDCPCDSMDPKGDNWIMVDVDNDGDMDMAIANEEEFAEEDNLEVEEAEEVAEEEVEETVEVPVAALAELMQLAGYSNYADKLQEYENEPDEDYSDTEDQMIGLSGGLNGPKKMYPASAPGDNPMDQEPREIEESVEDKLYKSYKAFLESEKISEEPMKKQIGPGTQPNRTPPSAPVQQSTEPEKPNIDKEFQDVVNSRNEIKINRFLAKQNPEDAKRLGTKYYGTGYSPNINPEKK